MTKRTKKTEAVNLWNMVMERCSCGASNGG